MHKHKVFRSCITCTCNGKKTTYCSNEVTITILKSHTSKRHYSNNQSQENNCCDSHQCHSPLSCLVYYIVKAVKWIFRI